MFLLTKGRKRAICRECSRLHAAKDCPNSRANRKLRIAALKQAAAEYFSERDERLGITDEVMKACAR